MDSAARERFPREPPVVVPDASAAYGADREFDRLVGAIQDHFGVKRTHIPLMGVAGVCPRPTCTVERDDRRLVQVH